ncbi:hypothetical protein CEB3_c37850 [Peptococcaceae bacterium CEB3]|nr:hypothetical protein CEB3_c37850 [Peptococcaceae bacterium CEB3]
MRERGGPLPALHSTAEERDMPGIFCRNFGYFELVPGLLAGAIDFGPQLAYILIESGGVEMKDLIKKGLALALGMAVASSGTDRKSGGRTRQERRGLGV